MCAGCVLGSLCRGLPPKLSPKKKASGNLDETSPFLGRNSVVQATFLGGCIFLVLPRSSFRRTYAARVQVHGP